MFAPFVRALPAFPIPTRPECHLRGTEEAGQTGRLKRRRYAGGVLKASANTLASVCEPTRDFLGHVGGDDFLVLFQSDDWRERVERALAAFNELVKRFYSPEERLEGGIHGEDRLARPTFFGFVTLSAGAVRVEPGAARGSAHVSTVAAAPDPASGSRAGALSRCACIPCRA